MVDFLSRRLWWGMLWLMRRPWMRRLQRGAIAILPERARAKARENMKSQEAWARKHGLALLKISIGALLISVGFTLTWLFILELANRGLLPTERGGWPSPS